MSMNNQPERIPPYSDLDTSLEAALSMKQLAGDIRSIVYAYIHTNGPLGSSCDQAERALRLSHQTCSARFNELRNRGLIKDSGLRRRTRSGRNAVVYVTCPLD